MVSVFRRKIRLIEGNEKCRQLKKLTCKGTLRQVFIGLRPRTPYPPPLPLCTLYTLYVHTLYLFTQGKGGRPERTLEGQQATKLGGRYKHNWHWLYVQSINSDKHLPQSPFTGQYILMTTFCFSVFIIKLVHGVFKIWLLALFPRISTF